MISPFLFPGFDSLLDLFFSHGDPVSTRIGEFLPHFVEKVRLILTFRVIPLFEKDQTQSTSLPLLFKLLLGCFDLQFSRFRIAKGVQMNHYSLVLNFHFIFSNYLFLASQSKFQLLFCII